MDHTFEKYGIKLISLNPSHLEIVRNWRNSDFVRTKMLYQEIITPEMQEKWFHSLNNDRDYYFVVQYKDEYVGLANVKDVDNKIGEPGFFLGNEKYKDSLITSLVNSAMGHFFFFVLELDKLYIRVRKDNADAIKVNLFCGFKIIEEKSGDDYHYLELDKKDIYNNPRMEKINNLLSKNLHL